MDDRPKTQEAKTIRLFSTLAAMGSLSFYGLAQTGSFRGVHSGLSRHQKPHRHGKGGLQVVPPSPARVAEMVAEEKARRRFAVKHADDLRRLMRPVDRIFEAKRASATAHDLLVSRRKAARRAKRQLEVSQ